MSLAEHYDKAAVAASQVVAGFDADVFRDALADTAVGVAFDEQAASSHSHERMPDEIARVVAGSRNICGEATTPEVELRSGS